MQSSTDSVQFHHHLKQIEQTYSKTNNDDKRKEKEITKLQDQFLQKVEECRELTKSVAQTKEALDAEKARAISVQDNENLSRLKEELVMEKTRHKEQLEVEKNRHKEELEMEKNRHKAELEVEKNRPDGLQDVKQLKEQLAKAKQELEATKQRAEKAEMNEFKQWKRAEAEKEARLAAEKNNSVLKTEVEQV
jgi:hypothetical protein